MVRNSKIIYLIYFLILISLVNAQSIQITKGAPQEITFGQNIEIKIHILNPYSIEKTFIIEETLPQEIKVISPQNTLKKRTDALETEYYKWETTISPNKVKTLTYSIQPESLGEYTIGETKVGLEGIDYLSNSISFKVKCNKDGQCSEEENYLNCPEDCSTGISDGICDYQADGICDPDCEEEPDCQKSNINLSLILYITGGIIIIILFIFFIPKIFKKKEKIGNIQNSNVETEQTDKNPENDPLEGMQNNQQNF